MTFEIHKLHHAIVHLSSQNVKYIYIYIYIFTDEAGFCLVSMLLVSMMDVLRSCVKESTK